MTRASSEILFPDLPPDQEELNLSHVRHELGNMDSVDGGCQLSLSTSENTETKRLDDYTEVTGQTGNMRWGRKTGRNGHWREKWVAQMAPETSKAVDDKTMQVDEPEAVSFGVTRGADMDSYRRWTESWRSKGDVTRVEKTITQFAPPSDDKPMPQDDTDEDAWRALDRVETWVQRVDSYASTRRRVETKFGLDERVPSAARRWRTREEFIGDHRESILFEERKGDEVRTEFQEFLQDGSVRTVRTVRLKNGETWKDSWRVEADGSQSGHKEGVNSSQVKWTENWRKTNGGEEEIIKSETAPDGSWKKGSTDFTAHDPDGAIRRHGIRWSKTRKHSEQTDPEEIIKVIEEEFTDTWWQDERVDTPLNSWGCKVKRSRQFETTAVDQLPPISSESEKELTPGAHGSAVMANSFGVCAGENECTTHVEKWHDNGVEKHSKKKSILEKWSEESVLLELEENGHSETRKTGTEEAWGENWCKVSKTDLTESLEKTALKEIVIFTDKWWIESNSNKWGKKEFKDKQSGDTFEENWYENGQEKQVDRWRIKSDGSRRGTKFGERWDPVQNAKISWQEEWGEKDGCERWTDKKWTHEGGDSTRSWGELTGDRGDNEHWFEKWHAGNGDEFNERYEVDEDGNTKTVTRGLTIRDGDVVNYYMNSFGECPTTGEKWAHKEGETSPCNKWVEKWSNRVDRNYCYKSGRNPRGDEWTENWEEEFEYGSDGLRKRVKTKASKFGKNAMNQEWYEEWVETEKSKIAKKKCENPVTSEAWEEAWGESWDEENGLQKWTNKWAQSGADRWGQSWGDRYEDNGRHHRWVEEWNKDGIRKWADDISDY